VHTCAGVAVELPQWDCLNKAPRPLVPGAHHVLHAFQEVSACTVLARCCSCNRQLSVLSIRAAVISEW
jgi:hypothetical protein